MFLKFKLQTETNPNVIYRRDPRRFEAERSTDIISVPLLEHYDRTIRALRAENSAQYQELANAKKYKQEKVVKQKKNDTN